uniref:Uncharacterized protein n=1 Tax=Rhizophora mucronata TaxID=61149 RepID=A0A2P2J824_RHIMU
MVSFPIYSFKVLFPQINKVLYFSSLCLSYRHFPQTIKTHLEP